LRLGPWTSTGRQRRGYPCGATADAGVGLDGDDEPPELVLGGLEQDASTAAHRHLPAHRRRPTVHHRDAAGRPDAAAKQAVVEFFDAIGYDTLDVGSLSEGWRFQRDTSAYVTPYAVPGTSYPDWSARPTTADLLRDAPNAARRYRDM
jgi:hypothetical protein